MKKPLPKAVLREVDRLEAAGAYEEAAAKLRDTTRQLPDNATLSARLILIYNRRLNTPSKAKAEIDRLLKLAPKSPITHELAAEAAQSMGALQQARKHVDLMLQLRTTSPDGLYIGATVYQNLGLHKRAVLCIKEALRLRPSHLPSRLLYASVLRSMGQLPEAEKISRAIFAEWPDNLRNYAIWSTACQQTADDPMYIYLRDVLEPDLRARGDPNHYSALGILGKAENDIGNFDAAFACFSKSKDVRDLVHDRSTNAKFVDDLIAGTPKSLFSGTTGHDCQVPVLIVGMPRTGSTLMEQILASHPQIEGLGESGLLRATARKEGHRNHDGAKLSRVIGSLSTEKTKVLATQYLEEAPAENHQALLIVDKK